MPTEGRGISPLYLKYVSVIIMYARTPEVVRKLLNSTSFQDFVSENESVLFFVIYRSLPAFTNCLAPLAPLAPETKYITLWNPKEELP